jgi:RNA polymerase sigma factor (sigma-70 family)
LPVPAAAQIRTIQAKGDSSSMNESATHSAIETVIRQSYGQIVAYLAARSGDVAGAEDALSDAFMGALRRWPVDGVPDKPEAWLLRAARNRLIDSARHDRVRLRSSEHLQQITEEAQTMATTIDSFPDERLKLLFVCAHPAIDVAARTPLMLQTVLGIDAARIASAFLVAPKAMSQRLVRAKTKIRDATIPFRVPEPQEWSERLAFVLDAIYAAYTTGWESGPDSSSTHGALAEEAIVLGRVLVKLMPAEPEAHGLLALMLHCQARREARHSCDGRFISLDRQDTNQWSRPLMDEAEQHLHVASDLNRLGRFQLEAAIQSVHARRAVTGETDWQAIALLYEGLARIAPGIGSLVGRAVALAQAGDPVTGLTALDDISSDRIASYQPYWAARAHLLHLLGKSSDAIEAWQRAVGLTDDPALRQYLMGRIGESASL